MYISAIEIEGFKSFADKTIIPLNKKLNIIIGPNGSGKSNIIDAISFVLGESSRNLRADKGVNLIYKGSKNVGKAIVSLVVDLENDYPEELKDYFDEEVLKEGKIVLSRQIKKSGESNYLINNQRVNKAFFSQILSILKLNTPYNIIFQGDITNIVKSSPIEKRKIIEELVNIDYFEKKKEKVQKELESAQLKLNELIVLLNEKRKLLEELKEEKEKAEKFLELEKKKNSLLKAKYINELKEIDKRINEINNVLISIETKIAQLSLKKKNLEDEIKNLENELLKINDEIRKKGGPNLKELEEKRINNLKEIEKLKAEIKNLEEKINEISYEIEKEEEEKRKLINEIIKLEKIKKEINNQLLKKEKELEQYNIDFNYEEIEKLEKEIEAIKEEIINLRNKKLFLEEKIKNLSVNNEFDFENIEKELNNLREKDAQLASEQNLINKMIKEKEEELFNLKKKYEEQLNEIMQDRAIKRILELKEEIEGLYGPLFMLGRTKEKYKKALEMAAGPRMRAIVVENEDVAKKIIEILKQEKLGILSFIPLNRIKPKYLNYEPDYGIIGLAVDLIEFDPKFEKAFRYVFGDTLVIEDFETAKRIGIGKYRMVTLDGELFEVSGVITGGYQKKRHSFIDNTIEEKIKNIEFEIESLKNRLKEIKEEREKLAEKLFELRLKKKELEKNKELMANFEKIKSEIQELNNLIKEKEDELKKKQELLNNLKEKFNKALNLIKEKDKLMREISELKAKLAQIKENIINNKNLIEEKEKRLKELNEKDKELTNKMLELKEKLKEIEKENETIEKELNKISGELREIFIKKEKIMKEINEKNKEIVKVEEELQELEKLKYQKELKKQMLIDERKEIINEIEKIKEEPLFIENIEEELKLIINELSQLKNINFGAIEKFKEVEREYKELEEKVKKAEEERNKILSVLAEIENEKVKEFMKAFNTINENFKRIYKELLEKGEAWLELTNKENIFEGGVEIKVKINNKVFNLKALSGGEQSLVALSLIFAIQEFKPGTFYVFDEVDAALDKRNSRKLAKYLKKYSEKTQFIVISHNEEVIVESDYLFGVSMNKKTGISKVVALNLTDKSILEKIKSN